MNQEIFKLVSLLPGLYYQKERIEEEIRNIEILISNNDVKSKRKYIKEETKQKVKFNRSKQISEQQKNAWANYTPKQRAERIAKVIAGKKAAKKKREKLAKAA